MWSFPSFLPAFKIINWNQFISQGNSHILSPWVFLQLLFILPLVNRKIEGENLSNPEFWSTVIKGLLNDYFEGPQTFGFTFNLILVMLKNPWCCHKWCFEKRQNNANATFLTTLEMLNPQITRVLASPTKPTSKAPTQTIHFISMAL